MSATSMTAKAAFGAGCEFRITGTRARDPSLASFDRFVTVRVDTGACSLQTYLTPAECEEMSSMLLLAAHEVRALAESLKVAA